MREDAPDYFERFVGGDENLISRARHDQPARRLQDPAKKLVCCDNRRCGRTVEIITIPGARRYFCPHCDAVLPVRDVSGGGV